MKIFLSTSFSNKVLPDGSVEPQYRVQIEKIIDVIEQKGHEVFCALREDNWRLNDLSPSEAFAADVSGIKDCDLITAIIRNNPVSAGIEFELGMAYILNKNILLLSQTDDLPIPYINKGLTEDDNVKSYVYQSLDDVPDLLAKHLF
jgi:hypothetical protein